jgi:peptide/nickel transport system permease protein
MAVYTLRRVLFMVPLILVISIIIFGMVQLQPGDPIDQLVQGNPDITAQDIENLRKAFGLDQPWYVQYGKWLGRALQLDFGPSRTYNIPAAEFVVQQKLGNTLTLSGAAFLLALFIGIPLGIYVAVRQYSVADYLTTFLSFVGFSTPVFWLGIMLLILFSVTLQWLPAGGTGTEGVTPNQPTAETFTASGQVREIRIERGSRIVVVGIYDSVTGQDVARDFPVPAGAQLNLQAGDYVQEGQPIGTTATLSGWIVYLLDKLKYLILPAFTLSIIQMARWTRFMRASLLEVINQDFIRTARSKGLTERVVIYKHALRNAVIPIITLIGLTIPNLIGGAVLTETVFNWPGMGRALLASIVEKDYNVAMVILLMLSLITLISNLLADLAYGLVDPRIRYS